MTAIPFDVFQPRVLFLDDSPYFLESVQSARMNATTQVTGDAQEAIKKAGAKEVDFVVSDLKMPGQDGVHVLEKVHKANPAVGLALLTGFEPTPDQAKALGEIGADVYYKGEDFPQLMADIDARALQVYVDHRDTSAISQEVTALRDRLLSLELMHTEWIADLTEQLETIPNTDKRLVYTEEGPTSVRELIEDIKALRPRGIRHLRLWLRAKRTVREARR